MELRLITFHRPVTMKKFILLIEDNDPIRENTIEFLELANYEVLATNRGKNGLEMIRARVPDLILCDIAMPEMDGYEFLRVVRGDYGLSSTPFIFFTAYSEKSDIQKGLQLGASDFIVKPFEPDDLVNLINKYLG